MKKLLLGISNKSDYRIVRAHSGYGMILNKFALVIKETKHAALLMSLPKEPLPDYIREQEGLEIPILDNRALNFLKEETVWRAKRNVTDQRNNILGWKKTYTVNGLAPL